MADLWRYEREAREAGYSAICGCDEAGAGPLAGRLYAAAVVLPDGLELSYLNDSKQVTPARRAKLFDQIQEKALAWAVTWVEPEEIDRLDILSCRMKAMQDAFEALHPPADFALIDGNRDKGRHHAITAPHRLLVKGDSLSASIAAASILAKVSRDRYMEEMDLQYPGYGFAQHKGYGTAAHYQALEKLGPCPIHRQSYLVKFYAREAQMQLDGFAVPEEESHETADSRL